MPEINVTPEFTFTWDWFIALVKRVLSEVFAFIAKEEGYDA